MTKRERTFVVGNGPLFDGDAGFFENGAVRVEGDRIAAVGDAGDIKQDGIPFIDVKGNLILPGLVNLHHHFYSALAAGLLPKGRVADFESILKNLWWRLDRSLDREAVEVSALLGVIDSVKHGVATIFDHHSSPGFIDGSLDVIARCVTRAGVSGVLCFEVSDRNGPDARDAAISENVRFIEKQRDDEQVRGTMGLHANFTLSKESLDKTARALPKGAGVHIHCGEGACDAAFCRKEGFGGPADRLKSFGLLDDRAILAHGVHLTPAEHDMIRRSGAYLVHNPESNSNNAVGMLSADAAGFGLGTDGMTSSMLSTLRAAFLQRRGVKGTPEYGPGEVMDALFRVNARAASSFLGTPVGTLERGARADIVVMDYAPVTPIGKDNMAGHLIYAAYNTQALYLFGSGAVVVWNKKVMTLNEADIRKRARDLAPRIRKEFGKG